MMYDTESGLHTEEFKVRLTKMDAEWVRAQARKSGTKPAILMRTFTRREIDRSVASLTGGAKNGRRA